MKLLILDRDGVINQDSDQYIKSPDEWRPIAGSIEAIARLTQYGYTITVATNQSGIGRGFYDHDMLTAIHNKMNRLIEHAGGKIDTIFYCPHLPQDSCECRKPKVGLLKNITKHYDYDLKDTPLVGDSLRDLQAGESMQCQPILVLTGNGEKTLMEKHKINNLRVFNSLLDATKKCLLF